MYTTKVRPEATSCSLALFSWGQLRRHQSPALFLWGQLVPPIRLVSSPITKVFTLVCGQQFPKVGKQAIYWLTRFWKLLSICKSKQLGYKTGKLHYYKVQISLTSCSWKEKSHLDTQVYNRAITVLLQVSVCFVMYIVISARLASVYFSFNHTVHFTVAEKEASNSKEDSSNFLVKPYCWTKYTCFLHNFWLLP